jgi:hypothetical protein
MLDFADGAHLSIVFDCDYGGIGRLSLINNRRISNRPGQRINNQPISNQPVDQSKNAKPSHEGFLLPTSY